LLVELPRDDAGDQKGRYHEENINADEAGEPEMADRGDLRESKNPGFRRKSRLPNRAFSKLRNGLFGTLKNSRKIPFIQ
jgi:hypothetical protein